MIYVRRQELKARRWSWLRRAWRALRAFVVAAFWLIAWLIGLYVFVAATFGCTVLYVAGPLGLR